MMEEYELEKKNFVYTVSPKASTSNHSISISLLDGGTYTCILTTETAEEMSEEHVTVTVFERVEDTEIRHRVISRSENTSDGDFDVKCLKYQVKMNQSMKLNLSYLALFFCLLVNCLKLIGK